MKTTMRPATDFFGADAADEPDIQVVDLAGEPSAGAVLAEAADSLVELGYVVARLPSGRLTLLWPLTDRKRTEEHAWHTNRHHAGHGGELW